MALTISFCSQRHWILWPLPSDRGLSLFPWLLSPYQGIWEPSNALLILENEQCLLKVMYFLCPCFTLAIGHHVWCCTIYNVQLDSLRCLQPRLAVPGQVGQEPDGAVKATMSFLPQFLAPLGATFMA